MKIGILQTGAAPDTLLAKHGDYDSFFRVLLAGRGFTFVTFRVLDGVLPDAPDEADGWIVTGSRFGVYEDHPWIPLLEDFLRATHARGIPIAGICFGHQIMAQALGGRVEKFAGGWSVGATDYTFEDGTVETLMAWHQDQVIDRPRGARVLASSEFCVNAALAYGDTAISFQPHPEFSPAFLADLLAARRELLPAENAQSAADRMDQPVAESARRMADMMADLFTGQRGLAAATGISQS